MKVTCNEGCRQEFQITDLKLEGVEKLPGNVERYYIECPNCGQEYTSYFLDDRMKIIQREIRYLQKKPTLKIKQKNKMAKLTRKLHAMSERLKKDAERGETCEQGST